MVEGLVAPALVSVLLDRRDQDLERDHLQLLQQKRQSQELRSQKKSIGDSRVVVDEGDVKEREEECTVFTRLSTINTKNPHYLDLHYYYY